MIEIKKEEEFSLTKQPPFKNKHLKTPVSL